MVDILLGGSNFFVQFEADLQILNEVYNTAVDNERTNVQQQLEAKKNLLAEYEPTLLMMGCKICALHYMHHENGTGSASKRSWGFE